MTADKKDEDRNPQEIEAEIADTREDLGDTVAAVADKADVKKQAKKKSKQKAEEAKAQAAEIKDSATAKVKEARAAVSEKLDDVKDTAADKAGDAKDSATANLDGPGDASPSPGGYDGSAGDIGSGPTGDIRQNPEVAGAGKGLAENPLALVAAAFVVGLAIGRWTAR
ncbi:MAG: DUF3618 domain-containing protein [Solirubrobacterales bacterium]